MDVIFHLRDKANPHMAACQGTSRFVVSESSLCDGEISEAQRAAYPEDRVFICGICRYFSDPAFRAAALDPATYTKEGR